MPLYFYIRVVFFLLFSLQRRARSSKGGVTHVQYENIISSTLNEDRDIGTNGRRGIEQRQKEERRKRRKPKGTARDWPATCVFSYAGANEAAIGPERGSGEGAITCFVLITPADKPDELIGCFLLLIARARERDRAIAPCRAATRRTESPRGQARIDVMSSAAH